MEDIETSVLYKECVEKEEKLYKCEYCNKSYKYQPAKSAHKKICIKKMETKILLQNQQLELLEKQIEEIQKKSDEIKSNSLTTTNNTTNNNNSNNNNNTTNNIIINAFGKENIEYLTNSPIYKQLMMNCLTEKEHGITKLIKHIYFNPEHPENQTIKKPIKKDNFLKIYDGKQWNLSFVKDGLFKILLKIESEFTVFLEKMEDDGMRVTDPIMKKFMSSVGYALNFDFSTLQNPPEDCYIDDKKLEKTKNNLHTLFLFFINEKTNELISLNS